MSERASLIAFLRRVASDKVEVPSWLFLGLCLTTIFNGVYGLLR